jgi:hypothetical protein
VRRAPAREPGPDVAPRPRTEAAPPEHRLLALQRAAGNQAIVRALARAPKDPPEGTTLGADPLPTGAIPEHPDQARVVEDKDKPLPGGFTEADGKTVAPSGRVGHVDRILLEGLPGNQAQQGPGQPKAPEHDPNLYDTAAAGKGLRGRALALIPESVKTGPPGEVAVIVHLHGLYQALRERGDNPLDVRDYQFEQQLEAFAKSRPGTRIVALMPIGVEWGDAAGRSVSFGNLNFDALIAAAFGKLGGELPSGCTPGDVIISAHSGGGLQLGGMLSGSSKGLPARLAGVFLFESWHKDVDEYIRWIKGRMDADLKALESKLKMPDATDDGIFAAQSDYLENGLRVMAFGGSESYKKGLVKIRDAMLTWWESHATRLKAAAGPHTEVLDVLWTHYQAQLMDDSTHYNAPAGAKLNLARALATLPKSIGTKKAALARDVKTERYDLSKDPVTIVPEDADKEHALVQAAPADYAAEILRNAGFKDPKAWFASFTRITFLGQQVDDPVHTDLAAHLKTVEAKFATDYGGGDPAKAGEALGIRNEAMPGARHAPTSAAVSMHLFGLAIDINYTTNPFISKSANPVFKHAADLLGKTTKGFAPGMSYEDLTDLDTLLVGYFNLLTDEGGLEAALQDNAKAPWKGKTVKAAHKLIQADLDDLAGRWQRSDPAKKRKVELGGFLDLDKRLVDGMGLEWGGSGYGDMMHFDMRNTGNGAKIHAAADAYKASKEAESAKAWRDAHAAPAAH